MNEHILLVMKWLDDPESVSVVDLRDNWEGAYSAYYNTIHLSNDAAKRDHKVSSIALYGCAEELGSVENLIEEYFKESGEYKQAYLDKLKQQ